MELKIRAGKGRLAPLEAALACALLAFSLCVAGSALTDRFAPAVPKMRVQCLRWSFGIIDKYDREVERGGLYGFLSRGVPGRKDGVLLAKRFSGMPLDETVVTPRGDVLVNGRREGARGFLAGMRLGLDPRQFARRRVLGFGEYWGLGDTADSYDSRYWGPISQSQIVGRLHVLF